jgi:rare lipoprotein A
MQYVLILAILALLSACQMNANMSKQDSYPKNTTHTKKKERHVRPTDRDGAPPGPLPSFFQKIFPVHSPMSRYGNPDEYRVNGRTYQVLRSSHGYHARGMASWYGTKFHSKRTSSGEAYNMYSLTAAHRTLPLPTYVRVKNLSNGRVAIVKVNDRGPFHSDRLIDLSYAAAAKLGVMPKGTAPVEIEALTSTGPGKARVAHYYLQAGAFNNLAGAKSLQNQVARLVRAKVIVIKYQKRYIVRVGPVDNKPTVDGLKSILKRHGINGAFSFLM